MFLNYLPEASISENSIIDRTPIWKNVPYQIFDINVIDREHLPSLGSKEQQKRMRICISQENDNERHKQSRSGILGFGIGASDIAVICGLGYDDLPESLWTYLLYMDQSVEIENNIYTQHGKHFESLSQCVYELMSGNMTYAGNMWRIYTPWILKLEPNQPDVAYELESCSPDRIVLHLSLIDRKNIPSIDKIAYAVELKNPYENLYDDIPIQYLMQTMWQIYTLNINFVDFFATRVGHIGKKDEGQVYEILWIRVYRSSKLIERIIQKVKKFLHCCYYHYKPSWRNCSKEKENEWRSLSITELIYRGECPKEISDVIQDYWQKNKNERVWE